MKKSAIKALTGKVLAVLADTPESRNSDQYLMLCIWNRFYPSRIFEIQRKIVDEKFIREKAITLKDIMDMPREDNIKRIRARIQNVENRFLPTSWAVAKQRRINEDVWKQAMR